MDAPEDELMITIAGPRRSGRSLLLREILPILTNDPQVQVTIVDPYPHAFTRVRSTRIKYRQPRDGATHALVVRRLEQRPKTIWNPNREDK